MCLCVRKRIHCYISLKSPTTNEMCRVQWFGERVNSIACSNKTQTRRADKCSRRLAGRTSVRWANKTRNVTATHNGLQKLLQQFTIYYSGVAEIRINSEYVGRTCNERKCCVYHVYMYSFFRAVCMPFIMRALFAYECTHTIPFTHCFITRVVLVWFLCKAERLSPRGTRFHSTHLSIKARPLSPTHF